ncbi:MAG: hypothetical protein ACOYT4_04980 [Nanoarchaeota archaeon]
MALKLSLNHETIRAKDLLIPIYKEFSGPMIEEMPRLIAEIRNPMNISNVMQRRLEFIAEPFCKEHKMFKSQLALYVEENWKKFYSSEEEALNDWNVVKFSWLDNYFDSADSVIYDTEFMKVDLDSEILRKINPGSKINRGALISIKDYYEALSGIKFKIESERTNWKLREEIKASLFWKTVARNQDILENYTDFVFDETKKKYNYNTAMSTYFESDITQIEMKGICLKSIYVSSEIDGRLDLDDGKSRLVGIMPAE